MCASTFVLFEFRQGFAVVFLFFFVFLLAIRNASAKEVEVIAICATFAAHHWPLPSVLLKNMPLMQRVCVFV